MTLQHMVPEINMKSPQIRISFILNFFVIITISATFFSEYCYDTSSHSQMFKVLSTFNDLSLWRDGVMQIVRAYNNASQ